MVVLNIVTARTPLILARVRTRALSFASLNALDNCLYNFLVRVKLPPLFDVKLHTLK